MRSSLFSSLTRRLRGQGVAYGLIAFGTAVLNNFWVTFYVTHFMQVEKLSDGWFYGGQVVFAVWNSFNDPLFGWMSDFVRSDDGTSKGRRVKVLRRFGPLFALSFLFAWFPWTSSLPSPTSATTAYGNGSMQRGVEVVSATLGVADEVRGGGGGVESSMSASVLSGLHFIFFYLLV
uniref:Uncharacterized protein n=1 Tax=Palpitomonas bilix TaxID=652834 RepID=A0A7S3G2W4_9EUKA|mmetsp:Transcript_14677/g.37524  ORF Transcript_14677/g.37524 Transcript_14677/m.37524 type:complete len:176 (+) Transcript_14677:215-742(+)